jgi:hypothetical protein
MHCINPRICTSLVAAAIALASFNCVASAQRLIVKTGFESPVDIVQDGSEHRRFTGGDEGINLHNDLVPGIFTTARFEYLAGPLPHDYTKTEIREVIGPGGEPTRALYLELKGNAGLEYVTRNQWALFPQESYSLKEVLTRYDMYISPNYPDIYPDSNDWHVIYEVFESPEPGWEYVFWRWRAGIYLKRDNTTNKFHLRHSRQYVEIDNGQQNWISDESFLNTHVEVPIGEWFKLEVHWRHHETHGFFKTKLNDKVVYDFTGKIAFDGNRPIRSFYPLKNYADGNYWIDHQTGQVAPISIYYDNLEIYDFPVEYLEVEPFADTYVNGGNLANNNYGALSYMVLQDGTDVTGARDREAYVAFDLPELSANPIDVILRLTTNSANQGGTLQLYLIEDLQWEENSLTWNTKGMPGLTFVAEVPVPAGGNVKVDVDLKHVLESKVSFGRRLNFLLRSSGPQLIIFDSRESANEPKILIQEGSADLTWAGYPIDPNGWADTTNWIGWVQVIGDFVYVVGLDKWAYLPESNVDDYGSWAYIFRKP